MKGIYLTQEGKKELEAKIADINKTYHEYADWEGKLRELEIYKEILSLATILPVEESWKLIGENTGTFYDDDGEDFT